MIKNLLTIYCSNKTSYVFDFTIDFLLFSFNLALYKRRNLKLAIVMQIYAPECVNIWMRLVKKNKIKKYKKTHSNSNML